MKRLVAAVAACAVLSACGQAEAPASAEAKTGADVAAAPVPVSADAIAPSRSDTTSGTPAYAVLYPGAEVTAPTTVADGAAGPGGIVAFTTDAEPEAVVDFYRQRAEAAGLVSVMAMNQGDARAYGASGKDGDGATLQVVADAAGDADTAVQLTWSAGR